MEKGEWEEKNGKKEPARLEVVSRGVENSGSLPTHYYESNSINILS